MTYHESIVIDGLQYCKWDEEYFRYLTESGITAVHVTLVYHELAKDTIRNFIRWNRFFEEYAHSIIHIKSANDILNAKKEKKVGVFFGAQNCSSIEDDIGLIKVFRQLGLLIMQLTYNNQSLLATGCFEENDTGITRFGRQVIKEMNRAGMIVDMSHSAQQSTLQAIDISSRPICISHANPLFVHTSKRNKSREVIQALISRKGILGFSLYPFHLPDGESCTIEQFCGMIAKTAELIGGVDGLAIGSDLCANQPQEVLDWMRRGRWSNELEYGEGSSANIGWPKPLPWFCDEKGMENIFQALLKHGFRDDDVKKIIGENWLNFLDESLVPISG